jgi:hypothetical protein
MDRKRRGWERRLCSGDEERLGIKAKGREVIGGDGSYELKESYV